MSELFKIYDTVNYNNVQLKNIGRNIQVVKSVLDRIGVYYDYTIKEGERADTIAYDYYGSSTFTWLIYACNDIIDPYFQWPLTNAQFYTFMVQKYGDYFQPQVDVAYYKHNDYDFNISKAAFDNMTAEQRIGWYPVTIYQHEFDLNEQKRQIRLISNRFTDQIVSELKDLFA